MLRQLANKKAQNTAEYALLIALVVAGVIAMQTYAQRAMQARVRDASLYMTQTTSAIGTTNQYEPYYTQSNYAVSRESQSNKQLAEGTVAQGQATNRVRAVGGEQKSTYDNTVVQGGI